MNDLTSQLNQILNNPEMMEQIRGLSGLFGQSAPDFSNTSAPPAPSPPPPPQLPKPSQSSPLDILGNDGMQMAMKLIPLLNSIKQEDDTTRLLRAIKPFMSLQRQEKIEEAIKLLQILKILPLLRGQGLLNIF